MIPKIIYYTWVSDKELPPYFKQFIDGWKKIMPDYEIKEINLENCPRNEWVNKALSQGKYVLAGHYARCQRLYETGGIYCDIDIEAVKRFDGFLEKKMFIGTECDEVVNNAIFGCEKWHPFMRDCMDYMDKMPLSYQSIELETGPRMFTKLCYQRGFNGKNQNQDIQDITIYNSKFFYPYFYTEKFYPECMTDDTHAMHHWAGTWVEGKKQDNYVNTIEGFMWRDEVNYLHEEAKNHETIVEIGSWKGRSTHALLSGCPGTVYAIDHFLGSENEKDGPHKEAVDDVVYNQFLNNVGHFPNLKVLRMSSKEASEQFKDKSIDMVFIDGEHTEKGIEEDIALWLPKAKKVICGHDYGTQYPGVKKHVDINFNGIELHNTVWTKRLN